MKTRINKNADFNVNADAHNVCDLSSACDEVRHGIDNFIRANRGEGLRAYINVSVHISNPEDLYPIGPSETAKCVPVEYAEADNKTKPLDELVFEAIGEASMCWGGPPSGVFDDARARQIGSRLIAAIKVSSPEESKEE